MKYSLILNLHRLIVDRWLLGLLFPKLAALCAAAISGRRVLREPAATPPGVECGTGQPIRTPLAARHLSVARGADRVPEADRLRFRMAAGVLPGAGAETLSEPSPRIAPSAHTLETSFPLSCNQQALYFLHRASPASAAYNLGLAVRLRSAVSLEALRHSVQALVDGHPLLRTIYDDGPAGPVQIARGRCEVALDAIDAGSVRR